MRKTSCRHPFHFLLLELSVYRRMVLKPLCIAEVLERYKKLNLAPYKGVVNPKYEVVTDADGTITDVTVTYDEGYAEQMLRYSKDYSTLPSVNK